MVKQPCIFSQCTTGPAQGRPAGSGPADGRQPSTQLQHSLTRWPAAGKCRVSLSLAEQVAEGDVVGVHGPTVGPGWHRGQRRNQGFWEDSERRAGVMYNRSDIA